MLKFLRGFGYAFRGIGVCVYNERNMRVHLVAAVCVLLFGSRFSFTATEWALLWVCIGLVMALEAVNTAFERLCDKVCKQKDPLIKQVKDIAAGGVLLVALGAVGVGVCLFWRPGVWQALWQEACHQPWLFFWLVVGAGIALLFITGWPWAKRRQPIKTPDKRK